MPMMFFYFLKIIFDISTSKRSKKYKPHSILAKKKKKNSNLKETQVQTQYQTFPWNGNQLYRHPTDLSPKWRTCQKTADFFT
jgi:hypothetical protein